MSPSPSHTRAWMRRSLQVCSVAIAAALAACGGGGSGDVGGATTPEIAAAPQDRTMIVGQLTSFFVESRNEASFTWEQQAAGSSTWTASTGTIATDGLSSNLVIGPVDIAMHDTLVRASLANSAGAVATTPARLGVVWGNVSTLEPGSIDFGPGAGGIGGADGGSPGGGDGAGAGVGGGLGKTLRADIAVARVADGASLGNAPTGATSGLVRVKAGPGTAPVVLTLRGGTDATYYDEGRDAMLPLGSDQTLHALTLSFDRHLGITTLTEAGYRYALNQFLQDPDAVRAGTVPLKRTATAEELARLTPAQIQLANEAVRNEINRLLPARYALDSISTLPTPVDNTSPRGLITDNIYGRMQAVVGALALAAARFEPSLANPALRMNAQLADDLTDGTVDGLSLDQRSVFGAEGTNAYGPRSLAQFLADAADAQFERFGDGTIAQPPAITAQPSGAVITQGGSTTLNVVASGSLLSYQWFVDGEPLAGATRPDLVATAGGAYHVVVSNTAGTVRSATVAIAVVASPVAPAITAQPASTTATSGDLATFTVQASGTNLRYQWQLVADTVSDLAGATAGSYRTGTAGTYRVVVTNDAGSVTSRDATLTVTPRVIAPRITQQPTAQTIASGQTATLQVEASGTPLVFQWYDARGPIDNARASSYTTSTAGTYHVVVSNDAAGTDRVESDRVSVTVITAPTITTQPASSTINPGQSATLSVVASGPNLTYQWRRDGAAIDGANQASFVATTSGSYTVVVSNLAASVTSNAAVVTLMAAPVITEPPTSATVHAGQDHTFQVVASGSDLRYQWYTDQENGPVAINGATGTSYTTRNAGRYQVEVANGAGAVRSAFVTLTVTPDVVAPSITAHPQSVTINQGSTTTLRVTAQGSSLAYQWRLNGNDIAGATGPSHTTGTAGSYTVVVSNSRDTVTSNPATVTVVAPPTITTHPQSVTINQGETATLRVVAEGTSLTYQWRLNGNPIAGANAATYATGTAGSYTVVVANGAGPVTSNAATVSVVGLPSITQHPASVTISQGQSTTLRVTADGTGLSYQWRVGGNAIGGANAASYTTGTAGTYTVEVRNSAGGVISNPATVTLAAAPSVTVQPATVTLNPGQSTTLQAVVAAGTAPFTYQWRNANGPIPGATAASLTVSAAGVYTVAVTNGVGTVTASATVNVNVVPTITTHPSSITIAQGSTTTLTVAATGTAPLSYQWYVSTAPAGPQPIANATAASLVTGAAGTYFVRVSNAAGSRDSNSATVTVAPLPVITQQPVSAVLPEGKGATFTVQATNAKSYQWYSGVPGNASPIANAVGPSLATATRGSYHVEVTNDIGKATSNVVTLATLPPPLIVTHPVSAVVDQGKTHTFSVTVKTDYPKLLRYQWYLRFGKGVEPIGGATGPNHTTGNAGTYFVLVSNDAGSEPSKDATLTVVSPPVITSQPTTVCCPSALRVIATGGELTYQWYYVYTVNLGSGSYTYEVPVTGATAASFSPTASGRYFVVVENRLGKVQSETVNYKP